VGRAKEVFALCSARGIDLSKALRRGFAASRWAAVDAAASRVAARIWEKMKGWAFSFLAEAL